MSELQADQVYEGRVRLAEMSQYQPEHASVMPQVETTTPAADSEANPGAHPVVRTLAAIGAVAGGIAAYRLTGMADHNAQVAGDHFDNLAWADFDGLTPAEVEQEDSAYKAALGWAAGQAIGAVATAVMGVELAARSFKRSVLIPILDRLTGR